MMTKACLALAFFCLGWVLPLQAFSWETATYRGREYVSLRSFCTFYGFTYQNPQGNDRFTTRSPGHSLSLKAGNSDMYLDGVHYVMSFPIEAGDHDWLVSRMDVIKLFEPVLRPTEISGRHAIRGVVIDAGHGGSDNGATSRWGAEKDYARDTAMRLEALLRNAGLKTVLTRRTDVFIDLYERAHIASLYPDYCFVSLHYNSATREAHGLETYCLAPRGAASTSSSYLTRSDIQKLPGNDDDGPNILLASLVHSEIIKLNPGDSNADRGVKRARFVVIKQNLLPAILVEGGFVSNPIEAKRIDGSSYRQSLAQSVARGVIRFVNVMGDKRLPLPGSSSSPNREDDDEEAPKPPPRAIALAPTPTGTAPSGLANEGKGNKAKPAEVVAPKPGASSDKKKVDTTSANVPKADTPPKTTSSGNKAKKGKKTTVETATTPPAPVSPPAPAPGPTPAPAPTTSPGPAFISVPADDNPASTAPATESPSSKPAAQTPHNPLDLREPATPVAPSPGAESAPPEPEEPPTVNIYPTTAPKKTATEVPAASNNAAPKAPEEREP